MGCLIVEDDIVKIGIWLNAQNYFKTRTCLYIQWILYCLAAFAIQIYFIYSVFKQVGIEVLKADLDIGADVPSKEAAFKAFCDYEEYHILSVFIIFAIMLQGFYFKTILLQSEQVNCLGKMFLLLQITVSGFIMILSAYFLVSFENITDTLINLGALLILKDIQSIFGKVFMVHL